MSTMSKLLPPSDSEIKQLAKDWFRKLDVHAPPDEYILLIDVEDLEMRFPDATLHGFEGFKEWYKLITYSAFNEVHTLKKLETTLISDSQMDVKLVVNWQANIWKPPSPRSEQIILDAYGTWHVKRSPQTQKPVIADYIVDFLDYQENSARL
jgi:hypothetical protein